MPKGSFALMDDMYFMLQALEASKNALPKCTPNPPVGCVLVKNNRVISTGFTQSIGGNHAEVEAYLATLLELALADLSQEEKDELLLTAVRADDTHWGLILVINGHAYKIMPF